MVKLPFCLLKPIHGMTGPMQMRIDWQTLWKKRKNQTITCPVRTMDSVLRSIQPDCAWLIRSSPYRAVSCRPRFAHPDCSNNHSRSTNSAGRCSGGVRLFARRDVTVLYDL